MRTMLILFEVFAVLTLMGCSQKNEKPNFLFILSDDQRADAIHAMGNEDIITPNLDKIAEKGMPFTEAYCLGSTSGAVCAPSRAMILTGRSLYNIRDSYLVPWTAAPEERGVSDHITLPEFIRTSGYTTFMSGKWHQDAPTFVTGFTQGKNLFMGGMGSHTEVKIWDFDPSGKNYKKDDYHLVEGFSSTLFADAAVDFLDNYKEKEPFMMFVAFTAPHDPRLHFRTSRFGKAG